MQKGLNLLFICSGNRDRSPTSQTAFKNAAYNIRTAGTSKDAVHRITIEDVNWANIIFVMEEKHKNRILTEFNRPLQFKSIHVLDIPNEYKKDDSQLIQLLQEKVSAYLEG
ncbi:MAG: phosphotyrosine protein phosphatase [Leptospiraceae bacterium]|nr:phosphotyrosine protein phosphatase [Leptospiraceae bacterium]